MPALSRKPSRRLSKFTQTSITLLVQNALISMYDKCGSIVDARNVFHHLTQPDIFSWNMIIAAHRRHELPQQAFTLFHQMQRTDVRPDQFTFSAILPVCTELASLKHGLQIHAKIIRYGLQFNLIVMNTVIDMYAKCGSMQKARELFDKMNAADVVSWNAMITGYAQNGFLEEALTLFRQMQRAAVQPNHFTFSTILPVCANVAYIKYGLQIHGKVVRHGFQSDAIVKSAVIDMHAKCGNMDEARELFDKMGNADVVSWNAMITGYAQNGVLDEALRLFKQMPQRTVVSWNAIIAGCAQNGFFEKAIENFKQMQLAGIKPSSTTLPTILSLCAKMGALDQGMEIHQKVIESGFLSDVVVVTTMIDMYAKCRSIQRARKLFDKMHNVNVVTWNVMITGYAQNGFPDEALRFFKAMPQQDIASWTAIIAGNAQNALNEKALEIFKQMQFADVMAGSSTFTSILLACARLGELEHGMEIHQKIIESDYISDIVALTALVYMYAKCGSIQKACKLFDKMPQRDVVSWNAIIAVHAQNALFKESLNLFKQMHLEGVEPDSATFASILPACAKLGALEQGKEVHQKIIESGFLSDVVVVNALIDMYAKCGSIIKASALFDKMNRPDLASWNTMIIGYAIHGYGEDALKLFDLMKHSRTNPDHVSFVCILYACRHAGLLDDGCKNFKFMTDSYCVVPTLQHYACMVDLLGYAGHLEEALNFIIKMPVKPDVVVWTCLLGTCRSHMNIGLGEFVATILFELNPTDPVSYVILLNIYVVAGWWAEVKKLRKLMKDRGIKNIPGYSWIEVHKIIRAFCANDKSHPQRQEIYSKLEKLSCEMKAAGYIPHTRSVLNDVQEKEIIYHHSEMLAIAFGLLYTSHGTTIKVFKNLQVCSDCHTATKFISKIVAREIVVRAANRFHHFKHGQCSCGDYW